MKSFRLLVKFVYCDTIALLRLPSYVVPTLAFPALMYVFFGLPYAHGAVYGRMMMASYATFAVLGVAIFQFGVGIANERGTSWDVFVRILPSALEVRLASRVLSSMIFAAAAAASVIATALVLGHTTVSPIRVLDLLVSLAFGSIPFTLLGVAIGYWTSPRTALPIANLIYLPLSFVGGLWVPPQYLPRLAAEISPYVPTRHYGEIVWAAAFGHQLPPQSVLCLGVYSAVFLLLAVIGYRRNEAQNFA